MIFLNLALPERTCYEPLASTHPDTQGGPESLTRDNVTSKGQMLWAANFRAVTGGIEEEDIEEWLGFATLPEYHFEELSGTADPVVVLQLIACYGYQTFNDPWSYVTEEAYALVQALSSASAHQIVGAREGLPWLPGDDERDVFMREH